MSISYWLDLFTYQTWTEFLKAGGEVSGFRQRRWKTVQQIKPGDVLTGMQDPHATIQSLPAGKAAHRDGEKSGELVRAGAAAPSRRYQSGAAPFLSADGANRKHHGPDGGDI